MVKVKSKNRIREFRTKRGMKQAVLADRVGIFQSEVSEIETGKRKPNVYLAKKIARALRVSLEELFFLTWIITFLRL
jgi:putative transcriptional regulator